MTQLADVDPWRALIQPEQTTEELTLSAPGPAHPLDVVMGAGGGSGASTLASGIALARARDGTPAVLVEFGLDRSDLTGAWDVPTRRTLDDLVSVQAELDVHHLDLVAHRHSSGVLLLPGPGRPGADHDWDAGATGTLLRRTGQIGASIIDAGAHLGTHVQTAVTAATRVLIVVPPTIAGARRVRDLIGNLVHCADRDRIFIVVNRGTGRNHLSRSGFVRACGTRVLTELPRADRDADEISAGRWPRSGRSRLAGAIDRLIGETA